MLPYLGLFYHATLERKAGESFLWCVSEDSFGPLVCMYPICIRLILKFPIESDHVQDQGKQVCNVQDCRRGKACVLLGPGCEWCRPRANGAR